VHCTEPWHRTARLIGLCAVIALSSCSSSRLPDDRSAPSATPAPVVTRVPVPAESGAAAGRAKLESPLPAGVSLPAPRHARNWTDFRMQAAQRMVAANQSITYAGAVPEPLLAIPVLEIELNADGSVRRINVSRTPRQATDTVQLAIDAVKRAAPYGDVSHLPKPWKFSEVFLFDDNRRFKPRTLDL